jgi:subtilisin family serine protease
MVYLAQRSLLVAGLLAASPVGATIGPSLQNRLATVPGPVRVVIVLHAASPSLNRSLLGRPSAALETRTAIQAANERALEAFSSQAALAGITLGEPDVFWLSPAVAATVKPGQVLALCELSTVASVIEDAPVELLLPPVRNPAAQPAYDATAAGLDLVGVRPLWHQGLTGRGTLVASLDTGVDGLHPALHSRYRGLRVSASEAWLDPAGGASPNDPSGHGTHTMGTVLGCEATDTVGLAPEAEWIAAGVVDRGRTFSQTISDLLAAFQWLADPDGRPETRRDRPDVVLNSWGIPQGILPPCDGTFWQVVDNLEALGTVVVFAAGNEGPGPTTLRQPADRGDSYLSCFAVGAVDALDPTAGAASFSSRGPVSCNPSLIKPEIVAPGVNVRSCAPGGGYKLLSGTSMAAPYVAGAVCLMRQYNPDATPMEIKEALVQSALDVGPAGPDYGSGYGLLNIPGAIARLAPARPVSWKVTVPETNEATASLGSVSVTGEVRIDNLGRSLSGVQVTVRPMQSTCLVNGTSTHAFDFVQDSEGSMVIPVSLQSTAALDAGDRLWVELALQSDSPRLDTTIIAGLRVGEGPKRAALAIGAQGVSLVATNTGRFDTEGAQALSVIDPEFSYDGVRIPLTGGLDIRAQSLQVSSFGADQDFEPAPNGQLSTGLEDALAVSRFRDTRHANPVGIEFEQRLFAGTEGPGAYLLAEYSWRRLWDGSEAIRLGSWYHWQPASGASIVATGQSDEICQSGDGIYFGCVWLSDRDVEASYAAFDSEASALPTPSPGEAPAAAASYWSFLREASQTGASNRFAVAFVAGHSLQDWQRAASRARRQYDGAGATGGGVRPQAFELYPSYPNPFNPATTIRFALERRSEVRLEIFNALGRHVSTLVQGELPAGIHDVRWQATDSRGLPSPSGAYFIQLTSGEEVRTGKITLLR